MQLKQLVSIRDSMKAIVNEYGSQLSCGTKVDFDDTIDYVSNIILDVERERKNARLPYVIYQIKVNLR